MAPPGASPPPTLPPPAALIAVERPHRERVPRYTSCVTLRRDHSRVRCGNRRRAGQLCRTCENGRSEGWPLISSGPTAPPRSDCGRRASRKGGLSSLNQTGLDRVRYVVGSEDGRDSGSSIVNPVPLPISLSTAIVPPCRSTIFLATARPRPVPLDLVVKNSLKTRPS